MIDISIARRIASSVAALALVRDVYGHGTRRPGGEAKALNDAFTKAFEACDIPAVTTSTRTTQSLSGRGRGSSRSANRRIEKIVKAYCSGSSKPSIKVSAATRVRSASTTLSISDSSMLRSPVPMESPPRFGFEPRSCFINPMANGALRC